MTRADGSLRTLTRVALFIVVALGIIPAILDPFVLVFYLTYVVVGAFLAIRRPANVVSWLLIGIAFGFIGIATSPHVDVPALARGAGSLQDKLVVWIFGWAGAATFVGFLALTLLFPSGHLPSGRWRRPATLLLGFGIAFVVVVALAPTVIFNVGDTGTGVTSVVLPNPFAVLPNLFVWSFIPLADGGAVPVIGLLAVGVISMLVRYQRAANVLKLQLRVLLAAVALVLVGIVIGLIATDVYGQQIGGAGWIPVAIAYPTIPLAIAVAVLRYRLYDIDRIVNRAVVYGAVTAILTGLFAAATALSQRVFIALTGETSDAAVVFVTLAVATLYTPVRKRVEAVVDRYFKYEHKQYGPYRDELTRLLELVEPIHAATRLAREVAAETGATGVGVTSSSGKVIATAGDWPVKAAVRVPIGVDGTPFGAVLLGPRRDGRAHDPLRLASLAEIGRLAAAALDAGVVMRESQPPAGEATAPASKWAPRSRA